MPTAFPNVLIAQVNPYQHTFVMGNGFSAAKRNSPGQKKEATILLRRLLEENAKVSFHPAGHIEKSGRLERVRIITPDNGI